MFPDTQSRLHFSCFVCVFFLALIIHTTSVVCAEVAKIEIIPFQSVTLTDKQFLMGEKDGKPVTLAGVLRLPSSGNDRLPVVILIHGSGGIVGYVSDWEQELNDIGVATFVIDSFTPRGINNVRDDQSQLGRLQMTFDAYRALEMLAKHPRVDPKRIAVMGFSRGGQAALYASVKRFQRMHGPTNLEFAAYIPFYAVCNTTFRDDEDVSDKPIRLFHGTADDWVPVAPCRAYVERLKAKGKDVELTEYAGAYHVFDWKALQKPKTLEKAQTMRQCQLAEAEDGVVINVKTKEPFTYADPCVQYGVTIAYDEKAATEARKAVKDLVITTLKRQPPPTSEQAKRIEAMVEKAAVLLEAKGKAAFSEFRTRDSEWWFGNTYLFVYDKDMNVLLNPAFPEREGTNVHGGKDVNGKLFHDEFMKVVQTRGSGWVDYMFPKPGQTQPAQKWSYVKAVNIDGNLGLIGTGFYSE